jgi:hypothetical protein
MKQVSKIRAAKMQIFILLVALSLEILTVLRECVQFAMVASMYVVGMLRPLL